MHSKGSDLLLAFGGFMMLFYIVAIYFSFQAYKEFKAIHKESFGDVGGMASNPISYGSLNNNNGSNQSASNNNSRPSRSRRANNGSSSSQDNESRPNNNNNNGFVAF
jgi:hypothetical protein